MSPRDKTIARPAEPLRGQSRDHMPCLDGLRGLAAVMVVLGHAGDFGLPSFVDGGASHCGVLIFFALSGFLMGELYLVTPPTRIRVEAYSAARLARIVPIYYLVVLAAFAIHWWDPDFAYTVTPVQLVRLLTFNGSTSVFWSIGPEVQFYAVFIGLWLIRGRLQHDAIFAAVVLVLAGLSLANIHRWPGVFVASKFHIFAFGMLAALLRRRLVNHFPQFVLVTVHALAFAILVIFLAPGLSQMLLGETHFDRQVDPAFASFYGNLPRILLAAFLPLAFSFETRFASALLANPAAAVLGRCSFSIYLLHVPIYDAATRSGLLAPLHGWVATVAVLLGTVVLSFFTYRVIEAPARGRVRAALLRAIQGKTRFWLRRQRPA
ncbi:acyltransferase family protein [Lichenifustis flavocetrariae]|uniref:Acyltransferase n=1 Tax=Lichenifustis flavocetrariae TaxID=2949735 RepID=A0AA41Z171_9HYPH|nr:acyltransferase [Lichenifustis flavocetrariae]MCW6511077.1 acyltransferase [Lichenifustis flavocetrariae]